MVNPDKPCASFSNHVNMNYVGMMVKLHKREGAMATV